MTGAPPGSSDRATQVTDEAPEGLDLLYLDNHLLVVNKPAGLLSQADQAGGDCVAARVAAWLRSRFDKPGRAFVGLVHRLDRNTSGVLVVARTSKAASRLAEAFARGEIAKTYLAIAWDPDKHLPDAGHARQWMLKHTGARAMRAVAPGSPGAQVAELTWEVLSRKGACVLVSCRPHTGRFHQIRAQLAAAGAPLLGDVKYGGPTEVPAGRKTLRVPRVMLHAAAIALRHPVARSDDGEAVPWAVSAPLPEAFARTMAALGLTAARAAPAAP